MLAIYKFLSLVATIQAQMEGFIVGGQYTSIHRYPHSAFLTIACVSPSHQKSAWICGSSIINQRILLTAGHCVYHCDVGTAIMVNMGDENRHHGVMRSSNGYILHERYCPDNSQNDIAIVRMSMPVVFNSKISRVAIMKMPPYSETAHLAGWGTTNEIYRSQGITLKSLEQKVWRHSSCLQQFPELPKGTICASSIRKLEEFAAAGDSGSALVVRGYIQIGLVSFKVPSLANNVIVYTDMGYFYEWITFNVHRLYCKM